MRKRFSQSSEVLGGGLCYVDPKATAYLEIDETRKNEIAVPRSGQPIDSFDSVAKTDRRRTKASILTCYDAA